MLKRTIFNEDHNLFREAVRSFIDQEIVPRADEWEESGKVDLAMFRKAGEHGFLGMEVPESLGGGGVDDFRFNVVINEEIQSAGVTASGMCITLHNDVCMPYFTENTTAEQKERWLPPMCSGDAMAAVAMTEPGTGSDLAGIRTTAIRDGDDYIMNGTKTFITNGLNSSFVIVAAKTDPSQRHRGMSLFVVEDGMEGFSRGRRLDKVGLHAQDTSELIFEDVRLPMENRLGEEGTGFFQLVDKLARERLSLIVTALAHAQQSFAWTVEYCKEREAFGQPIGSFQNSRFMLAEMRTELDIGQVFADRLVEAYLVGELSPEDSAKGKWWMTDLQNKVADQCLQLHGGYGYMEEYPIARAWRDARIQKIYGGTNEIMKEIVGRSLGF